MSKKLDSVDLSYNGISESGLDKKIENLKRKPYVIDVHIHPDSDVNPLGSLAGRSVIVTIQPKGKNLEEGQKDLSYKREEIRKLLLGELILV